MNTVECWPLPVKNLPDMKVFQKNFPRRFAKHKTEGGPWLTREVLMGCEHSPAHLVIVTGLVNALGNDLIQRGYLLPLDVLTVAALYHDVRRENDNEDPQHGARAARFVNKLNKDGSIPLREKDVPTCLRIIREHVKTPDEVNPHDFVLRFFMFCDILSQVRYKNNGVTAELLHKVLPKIYSHEQLEYLIKITTDWHRHCDRLIERGVDHFSAAVGSGIAQQFLKSDDKNWFDELDKIRRKVGVPRRKAHSSDPWG
ncbi:hypothetical protein HY345_01435 [Candidatus Microgenomates bacterium]|nr:hypothetical protein [Candidatus Microgenomates bacterium]